MRIIEFVSVPSEIGLEADWALLSYVFFYIILSMNPVGGAMMCTVINQKL